LSNFNVSQLEKCLALGHVDSLQPPYSLARRAAEKELLPFCRERGIGVVAYSPMMSGLLTGRFDRSRLAPDDWRQGSPYFKEPRLGKSLELVEELKPIAERSGKTVGQLAVAWVLGQEAVTAAIVGGRRPAQVEEILGAAGWKLSDEDRRAIDEISNRIFGEDAFKDAN
jgi:aryl-alcohol dehydrogenase-like predicted oxidoreductase